MSCRRSPYTYLKNLLLLALALVPCIALEAEELRVLQGQYVVSLPQSLRSSQLQADDRDRDVVFGISSLGSPTLQLYRVGVIASGTPREVAYDSARAQQDCHSILTTLPAGASCDPDYVVRASVTANDSFAQNLWGLSGTFGIGAPAAWDVTTGSLEVVVAVVDTGVDYTHPDLKENIYFNSGEIPGNRKDDDGNGYVDDVNGYDFVNRDGDPFDDNGHGTHVAGTIGAVGNNGVGVAGVAWRVKILPLKFLSASGSGSISGAVQALNYIAMLRRRGVAVRVANNSWGGGGFSKALLEAIRILNDQGVLFVAAAGNEGSDNDDSPSYPASYQVANVISVAAIDSQGNMASFSNYGASSVHIGAPGVDILSTLPGARYGSLSGTSMATPHVSGAAALILSAYADLGVSDIRGLLLSQGRDLLSLHDLTSTGMTLDVGRIFSSDGSPSPAPTPIPEPSCSYGIDSGFPLEVPQDEATTLLQSDEGTVTVALKYPLQFYGKTVFEVQVSANGVVYFSPTTDVVLDYEPGNTAPNNSIAVFHTDLNTSTGAVRMLELPEATWFIWEGSHYYAPASRVLAVLKVGRDGVFEVRTQGLNSAMTKVITTNATIGVRKVSAASAATYSAGSALIRDGVSARFSPYCDGASMAAQARTIRLRGVGGKKKVNRGARFNLLVTGDGTGSLPTELRVKSKSGWCSAYTTVPLLNGRASMQGTLPKRDRIQQVVAYSGRSSDILRVNALQQTQARKKLKSSSSVCDALLAGLSLK